MSARWNKQPVATFFPAVKDRLRSTGLLPDWRMSMEFPPVNISKDEEVYKVLVAVPGYKKEDFKIEVKEGILFVSAERKESSEEQTKDYVHREYDFHTFQREIRISTEVSIDDIQANYANGILTITLPKLKKGESAGTLIPVS